MHHVARGRTPAGSKRGHAPAGSKREPSPAGSKREPSPAGSKHGPSPAGSKRRRLLSGSALIGTLAVASTLFPAAANAQCAPDPATTGDNVVCTGTDTDGFTTFADGVSLTIEESARATGPANASAVIVMAGNGGSFTNLGSIEGSPTFAFGGAVALGGGSPDGMIGINEGDIFSSAPGARILSLFQGVERFDNREGGTIRAAQFGIGVELGGGFHGLLQNNGVISAEAHTTIFSNTLNVSRDKRHASVENTKTGRIISETGTAIAHIGPDTISVSNSGVIRGGKGIEVNVGSSVINAAGGLIEGTAGAALTSTAIQGRAKFTNDGTLRSNGDTLRGNSYQLINRGVIEGNVSQNSGLGAQDVLNAGEILGNVDLGEFHDAVENTGSIVGDVSLGGGWDIFRDFGGAVTGAVDLGAGDDFLLIKTGTDRATIAGGITGGAGLDSFGFSVEDAETLSFEPVSGFEGFVVEARYAKSVATLAAAEYNTTISAFGAGEVVNNAIISSPTGDAIRIYSDGFDGNFLDSPFGRGLSFVNAGTLSSLGFAIRSMTDVQTGGGADTIINRGQINGKVYLGSGADTLINESTISGSIDTSGSPEVDLDTIINNGKIVGSITTGLGDDLFINAGLVTGSVDLGAGDDEYLIDLDFIDTASTGQVSGGDGNDAIGYSTTGSASVTLGAHSGFERAAARAEGPDARLEITGVTEGQSLPGLKVSGSGTIVNRANVEGYVGRFYEAPPAIDVAAGTTLENFGALGGSKAILATEAGSTIINNANLQRPPLSGDTTGNTGVIHDWGYGTTIINNGNIETTAYSTAGVFIGLSSFGGGAPSPTVARSTLTNNGRISSSAFGVNINTPHGADVINHGEIDDIVAERTVAGISITNSATGVLGAISINGTLFPSGSDGSIRIVNDGRIEAVSYLPAIQFRDFPSWARLNPIYDDHVTNSGTIIGDIIFNSGADTFTVVGDGSVVGRIDGGADSDTVFFQDLSGLLAFDDFINFETIDISSTTTNEIGAASGDLSVFERLRISSGATTLSTDIAIATEVDNGATLTGAGVTTGDLSVAGILAPTPGSAAFRVGGDLTLADTAVIDLRVTDNAASRLVVDGAATLAGARVDYTVENRPLLDLDLNASFAFNGQRTGTFSSLDFFNSPTSRTTIGANAGFNSLFDRLAIRQGLVLVQSELRGDVYVGAAGVLGGNGTIVGDVTADGVIAPGASIGALTINGDLILGPASTLAIETDANGTDLLTVTGNANLGGALVLLGDTGGATRKRSFQFLDVGGSASGTFDSIALSSGLSALNTVSIGPDGSVSLVVTPQLALNVALDPAAQGAASYFNALIANDQGNAATDAILTALAPLAASPAALETTLRSLQPETYAASIHAGARQALTVADTIRPRTSASQRGEGFSAWLSASDGSSDVDANPARGLSGHSTDTTSTIGGVEYAGRGYLFGGYGGAIQTDQSLAAQSTSADGVALGAYAALDLGPFRSSLNVGYIDSDATARRSVAALGETVTAEHDLTALTAQADLSTSLSLGAFSLTPLVGAVFAHVERGAASEAGGNAALDIEENGEDFLFLDAGATLARSFELGGGVTLSPSIWAGWRHELLAPTVSARGGLRGTSTNGLYTLSAQPDRSRLALRAALDVGFSEMVSASVGYEGEFGDTTDTSAVSGTLNLRF